MSRFAKQIILGAVGIAIAVAVFLLLQRTINPPIPSPTPDPRTGLAPITILSQQLLQVTDHSFDFVAKVRNPNTEYGSGDVQYELTAHHDGTGGNDNIEVVRRGSFYILPGQTKYLIVTPITSANQLRTAKLAIKSVRWQSLDPLISQGVNLVVTDTSYVPQNSLGVFSKVGGAVLNNSNFDINQIDVSIVAVDAGDTPLAVSHTEIRTFLAKTKRGFEVSWFTPFAGTVARVDAEANVNVFQNSALLHEYGGGGRERFQQY
ncbi:MAG: hypothetical protein A3A33_02950 [Candidatus Yanofskybacteria bacterium RIFCSPLOWO2_01_FULL_49_25]|uniref:Uncharacterized protein n=1 Tax=Candidatus Yanofskybacteria bacterium RIFCSPLOWO2_01_FULL_49_25 TaxID=1802701 RepID=A0A1F8GUT2_9BACT|nr:MAG: hypothetical protein A3A33_02950 [Candidatus Yanofskybacteria bacterium RIFCSPLOWO2_01_FULL_49_25]